MDSEPTPLHLLNLPRWLKATAELEARLYRGHARPLTLERRLSRVFPRVRRPLFVLGAPRSGTSLLGDLIGALPEFSYHFEPPITKAAARYVAEGRWSYAKAWLFYRLAYGWLIARHRDGDLRFAEKTPQNAFIVPFLARAFPDAQFLHIVRDGRDAALSYAKKPWITEAGRGSGRREHGGYPFGPVARFWVEPERRAEFESTSDLHRCIWAWRRHVEAAQSALAALPPERRLEVRYEALVADPQAVATAALDFLGIADRESRRQLERTLAAVKGDSVGRHERELKPDDRPLMEREAGDLLAELGYLDRAR